MHKLSFLSECTRERAQDSRAERCSKSRRVWWLEVRGRTREARSFNHRLGGEDRATECWWDANSCQVLQEGGGVLRHPQRQCVISRRGGWLKKEGERRREETERDFGPSAQFINYSRWLSKVLRLLSEPQEERRLRLWNKNNWMSLFTFITMFNIMWAGQIMSVQSLRSEDRGLHVTEIRILNRKYE